MNTRTTVALTIAVTILVALPVGAQAMGSGGGKAKMDKEAAMTQSVYVCPDCHTMALKAGKCTGCQKDMKEMHLLGTKDGQAMMCDCAAGCKCNAKGIKEGKCACGKEVKTMSCKGMYCCPLGCPELSDKPGKCACGMDMKKSE